MAIDNLFARGARMVHEEAVELTLASLRAYWDRHEHVAVSWSGGKDSTAVLTLIVHLIEAGELPRPRKLHVFYADTRQELPPIQQSAEAIMAKLRDRDWIDVEVVRAPLDMIIAGDAARACGRRYVGCEIDPDYAAAARQRLSSTLPLGSAA